MHVLMQVLNAIFILYSEDYNNFFAGNMLQVIELLEHWMKLFCLDQPVAMNFQSSFFYLKHERGTANIVNYIYI